MINLTKATGETAPAEPPAPAHWIRAYLPGRHLAVALYDGSGVLAARIWSWLTTGDAAQVRRRLGTGAGALYVLGWLSLNGTAYVPALCATAWTVLALGFSTPPVRDHEVEEHDEDQEHEHDGDQEQQEVLPPPLDADTVARAVREIAGNRVGAHLSDLADRLDATDAELRACLAAAGIPVAPVNLKRDGRQRNRSGIRVTALPAGLGEGPAGPLSGPPVEAPAGPLPAPAEGASAGPPNPSPPRPPRPRPGDR